MGKDVNIHIKTPGAREGKRRLDDVGKSASGVGDKARHGGKQGAEGIDKLSRSTSSAQGKFAKFTSSMKSWAAGLIGIAATIRAVTGVIRINSQALIENAEIAERQQKKLLRLQYLGALYEERPGLRKEVVALSELGRRPFEEVADAWYNLRSKGAGLSGKQKDWILKEALEMGRTDPSLPLDTLVDMFSLYAKKTSQPDANRIQNVLQQTIREAGGSGADVAQYMPTFLPIGMAGGLTGAEAAGLWAYATTQAASASVATTGLEATFSGLQGKGTPESQELLKRMGITQDMNFFQKIGILSGQFKAGKLSLGQAETLAQKTGAPILLSILQDPQAMMQTISSVVGADTGDTDITKDMITDLMDQDPIARREEESRLRDIQIENIKGQDPKALRWNIFKKRWEKLQREKGVSEARLWLEQRVLNIISGVGRDVPGTEEEAEAADADAAKAEAAAGPGLEASELGMDLPETEPAETEAAEIEAAAGPGVDVSELGMAGPSQLEGLGPRQETTINYNYNYDNGQKFYPRVGDDQQGPRYTQD